MIPTRNGCGSAAIAAGRSIRYRTPRSVEQYIITHGLYRGT